jgi:hypothetical protein
MVRHQRFNTTAQQLAIKYLLNAIELDGGYADGYFNLGEAYSAMSQHDHAMSAIRAAMRLVCVCGCGCVCVCVFNSKNTHTHTHSLSLPPTALHGLPDLYYILIPRCWLLFIPYHF